MQEQLLNQLVTQLQERVGLSQEQATQAVGVVSDFLKEHADDLFKMAAQGEGEEGGFLSQLGKLFGR